MSKAEYIELYEKFLSGKCTPEEVQLLDKYNDHFLVDGQWEGQMGDEIEIKRHITSRVEQYIKVNKSKVFQFRSHWLAAASVLIICSVSWLFFHQSMKSAKIAKVAKNEESRIMPGNYKAMLTLANGKQVILTNNRTGLITVQGKARIMKLNNGQIIYDPAGIADSKEIYNTMSTPRGGNFNLTLSDGTRVCLNAASSITYPVNFSGQTREVSISGEAYFEVAKNPLKPFIVKARGSETRVLGTHFNIMAYPDEEEVKTTLFEGSVKFSKNNSSVLLKPGQQANLPNSSDHISVSDANVEETLAWKNGYFLFQDEDIHSIMRKVSRWYDVDVSYDNNIKKLTFGGSLSRYKDINDLLKMLQSTGAVHFKINERRITVMK